MPELEELLMRFADNRTLELTERLLEINKKIRLIMGDQFETQVTAWAEAFSNVCTAKDCGIIEAAIIVSKDMTSKGVPSIPILVMFASAIEILNRGKK